jgi:hypothetical protein
VPEPEPGSWLPASALEALHGFLMFSGIVHCLDPPHPTQKEEEKACKTEPQFVLFFESSDSYHAISLENPCIAILTKQKWFFAKTENKKVNQVLSGGWYQWEGRI